MKYLFLLVIFWAAQPVAAQVNPSGKNGLLRFTSADGDPFGTKKTFIQNIGQYNVLQATYSTDNVLFGYEGLGMPLLFTPTGIVHVQRKFVKKEEQPEKEEDEEETEWEAIEKAFTMKWAGANAKAEIVKEGPARHYFTYGYLTTPAKGFEKLTYKKIYPGIDLRYSFRQAAGVEFSFILKAGASANSIKWSYSGDVKKIGKDEKGNLLICSAIDTTILSAPKAYYTINQLQRVPIEFVVEGNTVSFAFPAGYNKNKSLVIDPFISTTSNFTGGNAAIAKDIDFDYAGNLYVGGGGNSTLYQLAKYDANGVHLWTFNGGPIVIGGSTNWNFGLNYGGYMVDKTNGKTYLSQGWNTQGVRVARLATTGVYDNYITTPNTIFSEGWRLLWNCNNGNAQMLVAGGGSSSNLDFGVFSPPSVTMSTQTITGLANSSQDIADAVIDPRNHEMYTLFSHGHTPPNDLYKHAAPYGVANKIWNKSTGFTNVLFERNNRPYLTPGPNENSINTLALNSSYLFYWDGKNLKAFDKATGNVAGTPLVTTDTLLRQGGIIADECGNVFAGTQKGVIKVYKFDGVTFNDAAAPDLAVAGYNNYNSVYDLAYDDARKLLYVSGRGFIASFDIAAYCVQATYQVKLTKECSVLAVTAQLLPTPPAGSTLSYVLSSGGATISTNTNGVFTGLSLGTAYTIKAIVNENCSGVQTLVDFTMSGPDLTIAKTPACGSNGTLTITAANGTAPYSYSLDGVTFQPGNSFGNLLVGNYTITVKDALGCITVSPVAVLPGANCVTATVVVVNETCSLLNGAITAMSAGGTPPYSYSIDGINFQGGNVFSNLAAGSYTITIKDATNGIATVPVTLLSISNNAIMVSAAATTATCPGSDGSVTATGNGGAAPYQFRIGNGVYQSSPLFTGLSAGNYTVTVKDANGCTATGPVMVPLLNTLMVDAGTASLVCQGDSVSLNATSNGNGFVWSPAAGLSNPTALQPKVAPTLSTRYYLTAQWGSCTAVDSVDVGIKPAPVPFAADTTVCYGQSVTLTASGGVSYSWSPPTYLNSTITANPLVTKPSQTITYAIQAVGANGCRSLQPGKVTVTVNYRIRLFAGNDTVTLENEPLQLQATDWNNTPNITWRWLPADGLSNAAIADPVFLSATDKSYLLMAVTPDGCEAQDSLYVKVYKYADIFVPTGFTPNGDGKNEWLKAVPVGVKQFKYFTVYNRWGQMVFTTTNASKGWDGRIGGRLQATGVFVWIAGGIDYKGRLIERKGTTVLIR